MCVCVQYLSGPDSRQTIFSKIKGLNLSTVSRPFKNGQQDTSDGDGGDPGFSRVGPGICFGRQLFFFSPTCNLTTLVMSSSVTGITTNRRRQLLFSNVTRANKLKHIENVEF